MARMLFTLAVMFVSSVSWAAAANPFRIRVLCYNIHHGEGVDKKLDLNCIARVEINLPWGKRDAREVTILKQKGKNK